MADRALIEYLSGFMTEERNLAFDRVLDNRTNYITVLLEDLYQAHNASAVLRTCDCFGIQNVGFIEKRNHYKISSDVALGAEKWLSITRYGGNDSHTPSVYDSLRKKGYRIVATSPNDNDSDLRDFNLDKGKIALVFGTELTGLSPEAIEHADEYIKIPMYGFSGSFNISVSASIVLFHLTNILRESNIDWQLSENEKSDLKLEWLRKSVKSALLLEKEFYGKM